MSAPDFCQSLSEHNLGLLKDKLTTFQINMGLLCNQACRHCHLNAGPDRIKEMMTERTIDQVVGLAGTGAFQTIDITGGAPELHPLLPDIIRKLRPHCKNLILRSNLTALSQKECLISLMKDYGVTIIASFPSLNEFQAESVRGKGTFQKSINSFKKLNKMGYGVKGSGLELDLVVNPSGAFMPPPQDGTERRYHKVLTDKWEIVFNKLFSFANVPLGRFRAWLTASGNLETYINKLADSFNPCTIQGLMCRNILSVSWDGYLYDCDFNQAVGLYMGNKKTHISEIKHLPAPGSPIALGTHCYTCAAGSGFT